MDDARLALGEKAFRDLASGFCSLQRELLAPDGRRALAEVLKATAALFEMSAALETDSDWAALSSDAREQRIDKLVEDLIGEERVKEPPGKSLDKVKGCAGLARDLCFRAGRLSVEFGGVPAWPRLPVIAESSDGVAVEGDLELSKSIPAEYVWLLTVDAVALDPKSLVMVPDWVAPRREDGRWNVTYENGCVYFPISPAALWNPLEFAKRTWLLTFHLANICTYLADVLEAVRKGSSFEASETEVAWASISSDGLGRLPAGWVDSEASSKGNVPCGAEARKLEWRVAEALRKDPRANSKSIAERVRSTHGSVRGTKAWKNRHVFRQAPGTVPSGTKSRDGEIVAEAARLSDDHYTALELWQNSKTEGRARPTVTEVMELLKTTRDQAEQVVKEMEYHFPDYWGT